MRKNKTKKYKVKGIIWEWGKRGGEVKVGWLFEYEETKKYKKEGVKIVV